MAKKWYLKWFAVLIFLFVVGIFTFSGSELSLSPQSSDFGQKLVANVQSSGNFASSSLYKVVKVVDGDTIDVDINGKVTRLRLIGMDTPEVVDPRKPVQCFGREASAKAKELLIGQSVGLESDLSQGELDKYGRTLRYVYLADGRSFNKLMIDEGYAHEYTYDLPYKYQAEYKKAQKGAETSKKGLWADNACQEVTTASQKTSSSSPAVIGTTGHTFYVSAHPTARYYYCDTDSMWKGLSPKYLKTFSSEAELLKAYPDKTLHGECK